MRLVYSALFLTALLLQGIAAEYNLQRAINGVYFSKISYCSAQGIAGWTCQACPQFPNVTNVTSHHDADNDSQGYVAYNPDSNEIIYAFRGTIDLQGWIEDGDFFQLDYTTTRSGCASCTVNCSGCKVHEGLYWGYSTVARHLFPALQALVTAMPNADILVTGHSMGAAHSGYGYMDVVNNIQGHKGTVRLYNYGCPRLGNPAFVAFFEAVATSKEHFRHTNFGDPVPHLPPIVFDEFGLGNWLHEPREVFHMNPWGNPAHYKICNGTITAEDPTCADSTPWYDMIGMQNHTTYLDIGLGCFLGPSP
jgi:predicted lipase